MTIHAPGTAEIVDPAIEDDALRDIYRTITTIAVVGASANPAKEAHLIPLYLSEQGYRVLPVSPRPGTLFGQPVASSLADAAGPIDVVDVFRPPQEAEEVAAAAIAAGASVLWFQEDTATDAAVRRAATAGLVVVSDRCMGWTHQVLGLGPGPHATRPWGRASWVDHALESGLMAPPGIGLAIPAEGRAIRVTPR